jgi:hypothetical protein
MKRRPTRLSGFLLIFTAGVAHYLWDCLIHFEEHQDLPWYETGIYKYTGPHGFPVTVTFIAAALVWLIFWRDK